LTCLVAHRVENEVVSNAHESALLPGLVIALEDAHRALLDLQASLDTLILIVGIGARLVTERTEHEVPDNAIESALLPLLARSFERTHSALLACLLAPCGVPHPILLGCLTAHVVAKYVPHERLSDTAYDALLGGIPLLERAGNALAAQALAQRSYGGVASRAGSAITSTESANLVAERPKEISNARTKAFHKACLLLLSLHVSALDAGLAHALGSSGPLPAQGD